MPFVAFPPSEVSSLKKKCLSSSQFAEWCLEYGAHGCRIPDRPYSLFEGKGEGGHGAGVREPARSGGRAPPPVLLCDSPTAVRGKVTVNEVVSVPSHFCPCFVLP